MDFDFRLCQWFFLPVNPKCTTTTSTTALVTTTTTTTGIPTTTTTTTENQITTTTTTTEPITTTTTTTDPNATTTTTTTVWPPVSTTTTTTEIPITTTTTTTIEITTTTTSTSSTTTTTTTIIPTTTTTTTGVPTTTTTTTGLPVVTECAVFFVTGNGQVWSYEPSTNTSTYLFYSAFAAVDIANTNTKLWLNTGGNSLREYNITLDPFTYSFSRDLTSSANFGAGLTVKSENDSTQVYELVGGGNPNYIRKFTVTSSGVTQTLLFAMGLTRNVVGDIIYNATSNTYLIANYEVIGGVAINYITEFQSNGTIISEISGVPPSIFGLYTYNGVNYAVNYNRTLYRIDPTALVAIGTIPSLSSINGASQNVACINFTTTTSTTSVPTTTSTTTLI